MGFRCTVFGHKWGDADTEREREEDGNEVVTTVREVRTCRRCGAEDVLGTSKEVTSLASSPEADLTERETPDRESGDEESYGSETDDGVILDEGADAEGGRRSREWPNHPDRDGDGEDRGEPVPWPETAREPDEDRREERFVGADRRSEGPGEPDLGDRPQSTGTDSLPREDRGHEDGAPWEPADESATARDESATGQDESSTDQGESGTDGGGGEIIEAGDAGEDEEEGVPGDEGDGAPEDDDMGTVEPAEPSGGATDGVGAEDASGAEAGAEVPSSDAEVDVAVDADENATATGRGDPHEGRADADRTAPDRRPGNEEASEEATEEETSERGTTGEETSEGETMGAETSEEEETMMGPDATRRPDDDAEVLESTEPNEQSRATAQEPVDPADHASADDPLGDQPESGPSLDPSEPATDGDPTPEDVEYYCPECDYVDDSKWPSRRAGDVCPNCRRSYLSERRT